MVNQISPHTSEGISGWLRCHNPSFSELGQVRTHVDMFCIEVVGLDNHLHQFTSIAHFCTVSHWKGIHLYFYLVKIQIFYYMIIIISWSCLKNIVLKMSAILPQSQHVNSLWSSDAIRRQKSVLALAQILARCLAAPSHYLNQCRMVISGVVWYSYQYKFTGNAQEFYTWYVFVHV